MDLRTILNTLELGFYRDQANSDAWIERAAADVEQVWKNAQIFNPAGHVVHESAEELRKYFDEQLDQQVRKEVSGSTPGTADEVRIPLQLVLTDFTFVNAKGGILPPAAVMQRNFQDALLVGHVMRNRSDLKTKEQPTKVLEAHPKEWHFECEEIKEGASCRKTGKLVVWVRTDRSWIRLMDAAAAWRQEAVQWLEQMRMCSILCVCAGETPREAPDRILRQVIKAAMVRGGGKADEDRLQSVLLETAEFAAIEVERLWLEGGKLSSQNGKKLVSKLLKDAEKERARLMILGGSKGTKSKSKVEKEDSSIGCALSSIISRLETDALRVSFGLIVAAREDLGRPASFLRTPSAQESAGQNSTKKRQRPSSDVQDEISEAKYESKATESIEPTAQGHWERDDNGKRVWVPSLTISSPDDSSRSAAGSGRGRGRGRGGKGGGRGVGHAGARALSDEVLSSDYSIGCRVRVNFDDGLWYVGKLQSLKGRKWRVVFGDDDEDDMQLPDPDAILVPSVDAILASVDNAAKAIKTALQELCESSKALSSKLIEMQQKVIAVHQSLREQVNAKDIGVLPEHMWSEDKVQSEMLQQAKASLVSQERHSSLKDAQWATIEKSCMGRFHERVAQSSAAAEQADQPVAGRKRCAKALGSESDEQNRGKKRAKAVDSPLKVQEEKDDSEMAGELKVEKERTKVKVWKDAPEWLEPDAIVEVESEGEWWQAKAVLMKKGKIKFEFVGGSEDEAEWLPPNSARIRPSEGTPVEGVVGEKVHARRPKDKGELKNSWNVAVIVEVKDDDDAPSVRVKYVQRRGVRDEWLAIDTALVRKLECEEDDDDMMKIEPKIEDGPPWPQGNPAFVDADKTSFSSCMQLLEFVATFGGTPVLMDADVTHAARSPPELQVMWGSITVVHMMQMLNGNSQDECMMDLILRLVRILVKQDSAEQGFVAPNALNFLAWLKRLIQKEMLERARRILHDRIEEAYTPEYELENAGLTRAALNKGRSENGHLSTLSVKGDDMGGVVGPDGLQVEVACSDVYNSVKLAGVLIADTEAGVGVRVSCNGMEMGLSDFAHFAQPWVYSPPLQVLHTLKNCCMHSYVLTYTCIHTCIYTCLHSRIYSCRHLKKKCTSMICLCMCSSDCAFSSIGTFDT